MVKVRGASLRKLVDHRKFSLSLMFFNGDHRPSKLRLRDDAVRRQPSARLTPSCTSPTRPPAGPSRGPNVSAGDEVRRLPGNRAGAPTTVLRRDRLDLITIERREDARRDEDLARRPSNWARPSGAVPPRFVAAVGRRPSA